MPWSIFTDGGGQGAALTWAQDLLKKIGAPLTAGNEQFVFDWELSEGGGGKYNPLNQGPVPGDPALTTTGSQYGGGAADYASWDAGLTGAADYLAMPAYQGIKAALLANDPQAARSRLIASPWAASHYGGGSAFSNQALPGKASALAAGGGSTSSGGGGGSSLNPFTDISNGFTSLSDTVKTAAIVVPIVLGAAAIAVIGLVRASGHHMPSPATVASKAAPLAALAA